MHWRFENKHNLCLIFQRENSNKSYMKIIRVFCLIAILAEMTVLSGEEATLSFTPTDVSQIGQDLSNPDTYGLTSPITDSTDITVNYTIPSVTSGDNPYNTGRITKFAEDLTANNFTFNINFGNNLWDVYVLNVSENKRVSLNSVSYNIIDSATSHPINNITVNKGGLFEVKGDLVVSDRRTTRSWYQTRLNFWGSGNVNINGNLTISSEMETMYDNALNGVKLELSEVNSFTVGGVVTLQSKWKDKKWIRLNSNARNVFERSFGGLNVALGGVIELDGQSNVTATTLTFTNSGRNEFNGSLATRIEVERTDGKISSWGNVVDNKLNVTMDASDPQNGYQVLRFSKIAPNRTAYLRYAVCAYYCGGKIESGKRIKCRQEKYGHDNEDERQRGTTLEIILQGVSARLDDHDLAGSCHGGHDGHTAGCDHADHGSTGVYAHADTGGSDQWDEDGQGSQIGHDLCQNEGNKEEHQHNDVRIGGIAQQADHPVCHHIACTGGLDGVRQSQHTGKQENGRLVDGVEGFLLGQHTRQHQSGSADAGSEIHLDTNDIFQQHHCNGDQNDQDSQFALEGAEFFALRSRMCCI